jgi:hypothetical protein
VRTGQDQLLTITLYYKNKITLIIYKQTNKQKTKNKTNPPHEQWLMRLDVHASAGEGSLVQKK